MTCHPLGLRQLSGSDCWKYSVLRLAGCLARFAAAQQSAAGLGMYFTVTFLLSESPTAAVDGDSAHPSLLLISPAVHSHAQPMVCLPLAA